MDADVAAWNLIEVGAKNRPSLSLITLAKVQSSKEVYCLMVNDIVEQLFLFHKNNFQIISFRKRRRDHEVLW